jgi:GntR family transcriptional regulator
VTQAQKEVNTVIIEVQIDFNSEEALYMQVRNQIILCVATSRIQEGDMLPSVRQLADDIGINMHTVNKAYTVLRQEGIVKVDRRRGAVIAIDIDRLKSLGEIKKELTVLLAKAALKNITSDEIHALVDEIYGDYA